MENIIAELDITGHPKGLSVEQATYNLHRLRKGINAVQGTFRMLSYELHSV
jgi:hypothetical protein